MTIGEECAELGARQPVKPSHAQRDCDEGEIRVHVVTWSVPEETEKEFYRRRFREVVKELSTERAKNQRLTLRILELLEEEA